MPEACQRVAGGRSAAQTPGQHTPPSRPRQGSHQPPKPVARTLTTRLDREPERRVRMAAQHPSLQCAHTHIRPLSGTDAKAAPTRGFVALLRTAPAPTAISYCRPLRGRKSDATGTAAMPARQARPRWRRRPFTTLTPCPGTPGDHPHAIADGHNRPTAQADGAGVR